MRLLAVILSVVFINAFALTSEEEKALKISAEKIDQAFAAAQRESLEYNTIYEKAELGDEKAKKWIEAKDREAVKSLEKSANEGDSLSQFYLGKAYATGRGTIFSPTNAIFWYKASARQGFTAAQDQLGECYANGSVGVPRDFVEAYAYYNLTITGDRDRDRLLALESKMTPQQIYEGQKRTKELQAEIEAYMSDGANKSEKTKEIKANKLKDEDGSWGGIASYTAAFCLVTVGMIFALNRLIKFIKSASRTQPAENKFSYLSCWWKTALVLLLLQALLGYLNSGMEGMAVMLGRAIILAPLHALWIGWIWWRIKKSK